MTLVVQKARVLRGSWSRNRNFTRCLRNDLLFYHVFLKVILQKARVFSVAEPCGTRGAGALHLTDSLHIYVRTPHRQAMFGEKSLESPHSYRLMPGFMVFNIDTVICLNTIIWYTLFICSFSYVLRFWWRNWVIPTWTSEGQIPKSRFLHPGQIWGSLSFNMFCLFDPFMGSTQKPD